MEAESKLRDGRAWPGGQCLARFVCRYVLLTRQHARIGIRGATTWMRQIRWTSSFLWYLRKNMKSGLLSSAVFRQALGRFATGVTVVTAERAPGEVHGMTANSFTAVSLEPLLILVCVDEQARMLPLLKKTQRFGVSVLKDNQRAISEFFAQTEQDPEMERALGIRFEWPDGGHSSFGRCFGAANVQGGGVASRRGSHYFYCRGGKRGSV